MQLLRMIALAFLLILAVSEGRGKASTIVDSGDDDRILQHVEEFDVSVQTLWDHHTRAEDVSRWMASVAAVELRAGGSIKTNYDPCARIGDSGTIVLKIVAYVLGRMLLLQADLDQQADAEWMNPTVFENRRRLYNLIEFEPLSDGRSRLISWGLGYGQGQEWETMIRFFQAGNAYSYGQLRKALANKDEMPVCAADK